MEPQWASRHPRRLVQNVLAIPAVKTVLPPFPLLPAPASFAPRHRYVPAGPPPGWPPCAQRKRTSMPERS